MENKRKGINIVTIICLIGVAVLLFWTFGGFGQTQTKDMTLSKVESIFRDTPEDIRSFTLDMNNGQLVLRLYNEDDALREDKPKTPSSIFRCRTNPPSGAKRTLSVSWWRSTIRKIPTAPSNMTSSLPPTTAG